MASEAEPAHEGKNDKVRVAAKVEDRAVRAGAEGKTRARRDSKSSRGGDAESRRGRDAESRHGRDAESKRGRDAESRRGRDAESRRGGDVGDDEPLVIFLRDERGAEPSEAPAEADLSRRNPDWAFAAGVSAGTLYGLGAGPSVPPGGAVLIERRVHSSVWLLGELAGGYTLGGGIADDGYEYAQFSERGQIRGSAGARFVFTPDQPLRLSGYAVATAGYDYGGYAHEGGDGIGRSYETRSRHFGGRLGVTIEQALTDHMSLGLSTDLLHAGFRQRLEQQFEDGMLHYGRYEADGYAGVSLQPMVQMRFFFD